MCWKGGCRRRRRRCRCRLVVVVVVVGFDLVCLALPNDSLRQGG